MQSLITSLQYAEDENDTPSFARPEVGLGDIS